MKKFTNKIGAVVLSMVLTVSAITTTPVKTEAATTKSAYVTIEKLTIGQGFLVEPTKVEITEGDTVLSVVEKAAKAENVELVVSSGYLSGIKNADNGTVDIPSEITAFGDYVTDWGNYAAPTNENVKEKASKDGLLQAGSYTDMSGWMYTINNESSMHGMSEQKVQDGDVIRVQFSIYGYGIDLGFVDWNSGEKRIELANKDALIKSYANAKEEKIADKSANFKKVLDAAAGYLTTYNAEQSNITAGAYTLDFMVGVFKDGQKAQKAEDDAKNAAPKVAASKVKSVKNVKGCKAKIKVKTVKGVTGYEVKYATNKKLKNAVVVATKKATVSTAKLTKNKTVYVKVRAYVKKDGAFYYGKWSAAKSAKIKK
jgi:hypothetical protein